MKFQCICRHIIRDQADKLPYKAIFLPDEDSEYYFENLEKSIIAFIKARDEGTEEDYIAQKFGEGFLQPYEKDLDIIGYVVTNLLGIGRNIYECENCGRIWIQKEKKQGQNIYVSYFPEEGIRGVLQSQSASILRENQNHPFEKEDNETNETH